MFLLINSEDSSGMDLSIWKFHHYMLQSIISEQMKSFNWSFVDVLIEKDICYGTRFPLFLIPLNYGTHSASEDRLFGVDGRCLCVDDYEEEKLMVKGLFIVAVLSPHRIFMDNWTDLECWLELNTWQSSWISKTQASFIMTIEELI